MKKILFILSATCLLTGLQAQTSKYFPFPKKGAWVNQRGSNNASNVTWKDPDYFNMDGTDTTINGLVYSKVKLYDTYHGALRDDNGKIYYRQANTEIDLLVYDFTVKKGDAVETYSFNWVNTTNALVLHIPMTCQGTDSVLIKGVYRKRINFGSVNWIEGIGNANGLFTPTVWCTCEHDVVRLVCMNDADETLLPSYAVGACERPLVQGLKMYDASSQFAIDLFPNPTSGKFQLSIGNIQNSNCVITDVLGRIVYETEIKNKTAEIDLSLVKAGIYFVRLKDEAGNNLIKKIIKE